MMSDTQAQQAAEAHALQHAIQTVAGHQRGMWVEEARLLHQFKVIQGWDLLGVESFNVWLADPDINITRSRAYVLVQAWEELVIARGVEPGKLEELDVTKVGVVLPAIRTGRVPVMEALADCRALSRSDLQRQYRREVEESVDELAVAGEPCVCSACGDEHMRAVTA